MRHNAFSVEVFRGRGIEALRAFQNAVDTLYDMILTLTLHGFKIFSVGDEDVCPHVVGDGVELQAETGPKTFKTVHEVLKAKPYNDVAIKKNTIMYAGTVAVPVYQQPTIEFDAQIGTIPYGEMVIMLEARGRFSHVVWNMLEGWVLRDDLVDRSSRVYPEFIIGEENNVDDRNAIYIRAILGDVFGVGRSQFPLQAGEYVLYRLWKKGIRIEWPNIRPRIPGLWHKILKGVPHVHVGVTPKVGSIMEYVFESDIGHLAFVEAVFPDDTITISEVNYPDSGIYNERVLTKEEWKELRPVFIQVA